ncbi:hypothetical protein MML48_9g00008913 [Holotrichia oblita]|uniref:Uncharacterized protein n=1 Tax=Holotrichia oblita TaxID=644536 RepID=A0ACB9SP15_HOLOL|nr:hypothetical protein MML48_9g00008913 [Holotrichia oblita]
MEDLASSSRPSAASQEDLEAAASTSAEPQIIPASDEDTEAVANANRQFQITAAREKAHLNLAKQAQRMKLASDSIHARVEIGDNIIIPIPDVDRAKADLRNIIGVVLQMDEQGLHKIGTKYGILDKLYCRYADKTSPTVPNPAFSAKAEYYKRKLELLEATTTAAEKRLEEKHRKEMLFLDVDIEIKNKQLQNI